MKKIVRITEEDLVSIVNRVLNEEKEQLNEQLLVAAILAYRQTANSKANRLTKKIKKALKDKGINNRVIQDGNFNKLMKCINSAVDSAGNRIKGDKHVNKELVRGADLYTSKKAKAENEETLRDFEDVFDDNMQHCSRQFSLGDKTSRTIKEVMMDIIRSFQQKTFHI